MKHNEIAENTTKELLEMIEEYDTIYMVLKHTSASGMQRSIDCYIIKDNKPLWIGSMIERITGLRWDKIHGGVIIRGCGMDMGRALIRHISSALFDDPDKLKYTWL
jgi:hypothetical protein